LLCPVFLLQTWHRPSGTSENRKCKYDYYLYIALVAELFPADRLAGGSAQILAASRPEISGGALTLHLNSVHAALDEPTLRRRLQRLVAGLGLQSGRVQIA
jgi:hypothetical protein